jgi:hypothetical protein
MGAIVAPRPKGTAGSDFLNFTRIIVINPMTLGLLVTS